MIRTILTLAPGSKADGTRCLRGELSRTLIMRSDDGNQRTYPAGTKIVLSKNHASGTYSLLAMLPDGDDRAALKDFEAARVAAVAEPYTSPF